MAILVKLFSQIPQPKWSKKVQNQWDMSMVQIYELCYSKQYQIQLQDNDENVNILNLMSKNLLNSKRISSKKDVIQKSSKQNVDAIYLIQNQNEILKLKNIQMEQLIAGMKVQLVNCTTTLAKDQQQCEALRKQIKRSEITDDIRLQTEKKALEEKIQMMKGNCQIIIRKIAQARQAAVFQQQKIPNIREQKKVLQRTLWECRTQNEGTKVVLENLQNQLEKYRVQNAELVSKRKQYSPKQNQISKLIEERLRVIKNREKICNFASKEQAAELIYAIITKIELSRKKNNFLILEKKGLLNKIMKKRLFMLSLIRKKYLIFVKNKIMQKFRQSFRSMNQLQKYKRIIENTIKRRTKNKMFRIWRSESNKREYTKVRCFEAQITIQKFAESYLKTVLYSSFNSLKYLTQNPLHRRAAALIESIAQAGINRCKSMFFSSLFSYQHNYLKDLEVDQSAKQHSIILVLSLYFSNWAKLTKQNKVSNKYIKFKYFRELKKLLTMKKKRDLSQMLIITNEKIKQIDSTSVAFCQIKKQTVLGLLNTLDTENKSTENKNNELGKKIKIMKSENKDKMSMFGLLKLSGYLKKAVQKAFNNWRTFNSRARKLKIVMNMIHRKMMNDLNLGFVKIQRKRFERLKISIADKIQSCQFSYNYLVKENTHIKEVLDNKLLELQKSKFSNILRRLIRAQKQVKHKYFYKFLRNGYKCWKFRKVIKRIDALIEQKVKRVFVFLIKEINKQKAYQQKIEYVTNSKDEKRERAIQLLVFGILQNVQIRNRKLKRIMQNVFNRNLELGVYNAYNKIKKIYTKLIENSVEQNNTKVEEKIKEANAYTTKTEDTIEILRERLAKKQVNIKSRIILACRKIYIRNSSNRFLHYFDRWRNKLAYEKRVQKFVQIMERKTRILMKNRLLSNLIKKNGDQQVGQLRGRLANFSKQLNQASSSYQKYVSDSENLMKKRQQENQHHQIEGKLLQKRTDRMDDVKVASFRVYWGKMICKFTFRQWKAHKKQFVEQWNRVFAMLEAWSRKETFMIISQQMRNQILRNKLKKNLSYIYAKKYRHNAGLAFKIWRIVSLNKRIVQSKSAFDLQVGNYQIVSDKYQKLVRDYDKSVNHRIGDRKVRKIFDFLKKYTRLKIDNNKRKIKLETWLRRGYQIEFYQLFRNRFQPEAQKKRRTNNFLNNLPIKRTKLIFDKLHEMAIRKKCFKKLFVKKFLHYSTLKLYEEFFARTKNYYRYVQVTKKNHKTLCIQKVMETFDKKRKDILCQNVRRWRKNLYLINIGKKLFKRITRRAIYNRYQGMFYAWKLESQAKKVLKYHHEEGQVKKRKVQIKRIEDFLHEFKKQKGLLLQNQQGNFVMSPRFQKKKQEEEKKDKNLRYKFISRLIMSINGYSAPIKAYHNIQMYMKLRERYRSTALFVLNHLRRPDVFLVFRTWKKAAQRFKQDFQNMQRKQLIKILNKQKDKMEMEYSHKLSVDQKIQAQLHRYKIYSHQRDRKEKLCAYVFMRNANKTRNYAFSVWRKRIIEMRDRENKRLSSRGQSRMQQIEAQIREMREIEEELVESNQRLREAVNQAVEIAEMVKRISQERDKLSHLILQKNLTCQSLAQENQTLNSKLHLAQKQAIRLLIISGQQP